MRRFLVSGLALASIAASSAMAADLGRPPPAPAPVYTKAPPPLPCIWCGWYIGANVGYGWGEDTGAGFTAFNDVDIGGVAGFFAAGGNVLPGVSPKGVVGGGQIGYDWQVASAFVLGLVADIQGSDMKASAAAAAPNIGAFTSIVETNSARIDWFGTVRARAGFVAVNNLLLYGTGGLAYGRVNASSAFIDPSFGAGPITWAGTTSTTRTGWAAGGGLEYAITPNWRVGGEYLFVNLGSVSVLDVQASNFAFKSASTFTSGARFNASIARLLVNYKF